MTYFFLLYNSINSGFFTRMLHVRQRQLLKFNQRCIQMEICTYQPTKIYLTTCNYCFQTFNSPLAMPIHRNMSGQVKFIHLLQNNGQYSSSVRFIFSLLIKWFLVVLINLVWQFMLLLELIGRIYFLFNRLAHWAGQKWIQNISHKNWFENIQ